MTHNSYYDDLALVHDLLERINGIERSDEMLFCSFVLVQHRYMEFQKYVLNCSPIMREFKEAYKELESSYVVLEDRAREYDLQCCATAKMRLRVKRAYFVLFDRRSGLSKAKVVLDNNILTPETITTIQRLYSEKGTIGFKLNLEEQDVLKTIEEYVAEL